MLDTLKIYRKGKYGLAGNQPKFHTHGQHGELRYQEEIQSMNQHVHFKGWINTCSIRITSHATSLIFQRGFPPLLGLRHISQVVNINMPSSSCYN